MASISFVCVCAIAQTNCVPAVQMNHEFRYFESRIERIDFD